MTVICSVHGKCLTDGMYISAESSDTHTSVSCNYRFNMKEVSFPIWYCSDSKGQMQFFLEPPERNAKFGTWVGQVLPCHHVIIGYFTLQGLELPILSWFDEPMKLQLSIKQ